MKKSKRPACFCDDKNPDGSPIWKDTFVYAILESDVHCGKENK